MDLILSTFENILRLPPLLNVMDFRSAITKGQTDVLQFTLEPRMIERAITQLTRSPHLTAPIERRFSHHAKMPVGRLFEDCVEIALSTAFPNSQVYRNVPVAESIVESSKINAGELDFVIANFRETIHLEVAVKLYLFNKSSAQNDVTAPTFADFVGPNNRDRLDLKLNKMLGIQLTKDIPDLVGINHNAAVKRRLLLVGILFYPWQMYWDQNWSHDHNHVHNYFHNNHHNHVEWYCSVKLNPAHARSWWIRSHDFQDFLRHEPSSQFVPLPKHHWFASDEFLVQFYNLTPGLPPPHHNRLAYRSEETRQFSDGLTILSEPTYGLLVRTVKNNHQALQLTRGFVVQPNWPI